MMSSRGLSRDNSILLRNWLAEKYSAAAKWRFFIEAARPVVGFQSHPFIFIEIRIRFLFFSI
ncbi:hypothetical protein WT56_13000 [Burkholderia pseudomultivorans]|uniref:Uncharacterized protein n=1 Tax=Burkholderia pseudomultivorans TaxID=1207504 RepID=A0A132EJH8_9BURK|nr:hypothetical protein WT56_13000 [Burkholderia pseudomultivorans]